METNNTLTYGIVENTSHSYGTIYQENEGEGHGHGHGKPPATPEIGGVFILIPLIIVLLLVEWRKWRRFKKK